MKALVITLSLTTALTAAGRPEKSGVWDDGTILLNKQIFELHRRIRKALPRLSGANSQQTVPLDLGVSREGAVFEEHATLTISRGELSQLEFYYEETNMRDLVAGSRHIVNRHVRLAATRHVEITHSNARTLRVDDLGRVNRHNFLRLYRDYLDRLLRRLRYIKAKQQHSNVSPIQRLIEQK